MLRIIRRFWDAIIAIGALVGIVYLPADLWGLADTYPWLRSIIPMVDRFTLLAVFSVILVLYLLWVDARPLLSRLLKRNSSPIKFHSDILINSHPIKDVDIFYANIFYLNVWNNRTDGSVLRGVQCRLFPPGGAPLILRIQGSTENKADIRHGEYISFELGKVVSTSILGWMQTDKIDVGRNMIAYQHNIPKNYLSFEYGNSSVRALGHSPDKPWRHPIFALLSADAVVSKQVQIEVNLDDKERPLKAAEVPLTVAD